MQVTYLKISLNNKVFKINLSQFSLFWGKKFLNEWFRTHLWKSCFLDCDLFLFVSFSEAGGYEMTNQHVKQNGKLVLWKKEATSISFPALSFGRHRGNHWGWRSAGPRASMSQHRTQRYINSGEWRLYMSDRRPSQIITKQLKEGLCQNSFQRWFHLHQQNHHSATHMSWNLPQKSEKLPSWYKAITI